MVALEVGFGKADVGKESKELTRETRWGVLIGSGEPAASILPSSLVVEGLRSAKGPGVRLPVQETSVKSLGQEDPWKREW